MRKKWHDSDYPSNHKILYQRREIAGIRHYRAAAQEFVLGSEQHLEFSREPENRHDKNAIAIYGISRGIFRRRRKHIGYVPADLAADLNERQIANHVLPRLLKTYLGDTGFVEILFEITGPKHLASDRQTARRAAKQKFSSEERGMDEDLEAYAKRLTSEGHIEKAIEELQALLDFDSDKSEEVHQYMHDAIETLAKAYRKKGDYHSEVELLSVFERSPHWDERVQKKMQKRLARSRVLSQSRGDKKTES